jgi:hypothetical protein
MINSGQYSGQSQLGSRLDAFCNMQNAYKPKANDKGWQFPLFCAPNETQTLPADRQLR